MKQGLCARQTPRWVHSSSNLTLTAQTQPRIACRVDRHNRALSSAFIKFIKASGLRRVRLHDLRHSHATHLLMANVHPKIVQERLGHANIATTMDLYTHVMPGMQDEAASRIDAALRAAIGKRGPN
jgi:integrase